MKKINYLIVSLFFFAVSYNIAVKNKIVLGIYGGSIVDFDKKLIILIPIFLIAVFLFYMFLKTKYEKEIKYTKCPKCKDTFTYADLDKGMCPTCNVKTIDMEKYYDKN